ncbi:mTERF domain-containing protein, partial [Trifolium medium]|nr:mTERF domain-containing protein [Trifolium medium]
MKNIRRLLQSHWEVKIINIYREANRCADKLASMGSEGSHSLVYYEFPPIEVGQIVNDDSRGTNESLNIKVLPPTLLAAEKEEAKAVLTLFLKKQGLSNANAART